MSERLCPYGDGRHKRKPWSCEEADGRVRSGLSCARCHKTWEWHGDELRPTYPELTP